MTRDLDFIKCPAICVGDQLLVSLLIDFSLICFERVYYPIQGCVFVTTSDFYLLDGCSIHLRSVFIESVSIVVVVAAVVAVIVQQGSL